MLNIPEPEKSTSRKRYFIALGVVFVLVTAFFISNGKFSSLLKGDWSFRFAPQDFSRDVPSQADFDAQFRPVSPLLDAEQMRKDWQNKISDNVRGINYEDITDETGKTQKQKDEEEAAKQLAEAEQKKKNKIVINISPNFEKYQVLDASKISNANPVTGASYQLCVEGNEDAVIKSAQINSSGSKHPKNIQLYVDNKSSSTTTTITSNWSGDFLTIENMIIPAGKCSNYSITFTSVDPSATWQTFYLKGVSTNLPIFKINDTTPFDVNIWDTEPLTIHTIFKSISHVYVHSPYSDKTISSLASDANQQFGDFVLYTKQNSIANIKGVKVRLIGYDKDISAAYQTFLGPYGDFAEEYPVYPNKSTAPSVLNPNLVTLKPNTDVLIPLDVNMNYAHNFVLNFQSNIPVKEPATFHLAITEVVTDATVEWQSPSPLAGSTISIIKTDNTYTDAILKYSSNPKFGEKKWIDSSEAVKSIADSGYVSVGSIGLTTDIINPSLKSPPLLVKNMKIKFGGLFSTPLSMQIAYGFDPTKGTIYTPAISVTKNTIVTIPDFYLDTYHNVDFQLLTYPTDPKIVFSIKPTIQSFDPVFDVDTMSHKKGDSVPLYWNTYLEDKQKFDWVPVPSFPQSMGIISFGPTLLANQSNYAKPGVTYVDLSSLPVGANSTFTTSYTCFNSQGNQKISELTYIHAARETSPFTDIKLVLGGNTEVFLKPKDWSKDLAVFTLTSPYMMWTEGSVCAELKVIDPKDPVEDFWFSLIDIKSTTSEKGYPVPVYADSKPLSSVNPLKGSTYTFK